VGDEASGGAIGVSRREGELDAIVRQDGVDLVGDRGDHLFQKGRRRGSSGLADQLNDSEFARAINGDIEVELAFGGLDLGDVYVHLADWVGLESLPGGLVAFDIGQPRYAVADQAAMQRRPRQMWDRSLQGIEAVVERQQRNAAGRQ